MIYGYTKAYQSNNVVWHELLQGFVFIGMWLEMMLYQEAALVFSFD